MTQNRKIKNATPLSYDGIRFRSVLEVRLYKRLVASGYKPEYEPDTITLLPSFRPGTTWYLDGDAQTTKKGANKVILPLTYTPDFKFDAQGTTVYLEAKGFENDVFPVKRKLFLSWIERQEKPILFAEIKTLRGLNRLIERLKQL